MTRGNLRTNSKSATECHTLNFFYDSDDGCALTTLVRGYRFHIICDAKQIKVQSNEGRSLQTKYGKLISAVRAQGEQDGDGVDDQVAHGMKEALDTKDLHGQNDTQDSGVGINSDESSTEEEEEEDDRDSAVDVNGGEREAKKTSVAFLDRDGELTEEERKDPERAMQNWMLAAFSDIFDELDVDTSSDSPHQTLKEWYSGPTYFYQLEIEDDKLKPIELESQDDLEKRISDLVPRVHVPKYITEMDVPWYNADELTVISESNEPDPYHPCRVKIGDKVHFLKLVDTTQPQPVKRELKILKQIEDKGLHEKFRVPLLKGLVRYEKSKTEIIGFLLTDIDDATPLTKMLDSDVIEEKRDKWAEESKRIVDLLHKNKIIWGDAKADNFMVDKHGDLWIIDFGGSYTDGWVDAELMETKAGDRMGIDKIVNALENPEANTYEPGNEPATSQDSEEQDAAASRKRPRQAAEEDDESLQSPKRQKSTL